MANKISFIIELQNRFSQQAAKISASVKQSTVGFKSFNRMIKKTSINLTKLTKKAKKLGKGFIALGKKLALKVSAPAAAFAARFGRGISVEDPATAGSKACADYSYASFPWE